MTALLASTLLHLGCQSRPPPPWQPSHVEAGSRFTLHTPLAFPVGAATLYLQDNQLVSPAQIMPGFVVCRLTRTSVDKLEVIEPATFTVVSVVYDDREIGSSGQPVNVTHIHLAGDPNLPGYTLNCLWSEGSPSREFPTSAELQGAIASYFSMAF